MKVVVRGEATAVPGSSAVSRTAYVRSGDAAPISGAASPRPLAIANAAAGKRPVGAA